MHEYGYFYIITNKYNTVLYCGATNQLYKRIMEHRNHTYANSFSKKYNLFKLVYFEVYTLVQDAFTREKQIKGGSRKKKLDLIEKMNPEWKDLLFMLPGGEMLELQRIQKWRR